MKKYLKFRYAWQLVLLTFSIGTILVAAVQEVMRPLPQVETQNALEAIKPVAKAAQITNPLYKAPSIERLACFISNDSFSGKTGGKLNYENYHVTLSQKMIDRDAETGERFKEKIEVSYVSLKNNGKTLMTFNSFGFDTTSVGSFPLLRDNTKQLIVGQDFMRIGLLGRIGHNRVVALNDKPRVIFDNWEFDLKHNTLSDLEVFDLDADGVCEIFQTDLFREPEWLMPEPRVIFRYDPKQQKYLPANRKFQSLLLPDDENIKQAEESRNSAQISNIVVEYLYACDERAAWEFFERNYHEPDKAQRRREIEAALKEHPVYRVLCK